MSDKKRKVPKLRFPGFTDAWEQRKLGEVINSFSGGTPSANNASYYGGNIPFIRSGEIKSETTELYLTEEGLKNSSAKLVETGDILYALYGATSGEVAISRINGAINQAILAIRPYSGYSSKFLLQWLQLQKESIIEKYIQGGQGNLSGAIVKGLTIDFAQSIEQDKIGILFDYFDNLISLHQRKLDNVKMLKKSLLQKLFPKDGEKIPELRFPGFTDDWEQRKVGDFLTESRVKGSNGKVSKKLTVKLWGKGVVEKNTTYHGSEATQYYTRFSGQFIYGKLDFLNQAFGIIPEELDGYESTLDSPAFDVSPALNKDFFLDYVSREQFYLVQGIIANGSRKAKRIHSDTFFEMPILLPEFNEQKVISDFTSKFDSLISLHQRKLDHLKELKKGLLQQMFV